MLAFDILVSIVRVPVVETAATTLMVSLVNISNTAIVLARDVDGRGGLAALASGSAIT